jgi:hypothetical protein
VQRKNKILPGTTNGARKKINVQKEEGNIFKKT